MNEEKYTRDSAKKSTRKRKVNPDIHAEKSHGEKLKNDSSAARSYRDKIRYGKKDNSLSVSEAKELRSMKKQGRRNMDRQGNILPKFITAVTIWMPCREQKERKKPERREKAPCQLP